MRRYGGNSINFGANTGGCPTGLGPCAIFGPESQIETDTGKTRTGINAFFGAGTGGEVKDIGMGIWVGTEFTTISDQPELTVSYVNLIHAEFAGFALEFNYTPDVSPK